MLTKICALLISAVALVGIPSSAAFTVAPKETTCFKVRPETSMHLSKNGMNINDECKTMTKKVASATAALVAAFPSIAMAVAEAEGDYEYGAVDAPISIAWVGGVFLILTSFLPLAMKGGEEAFEEMKERDSGTFGKRNNVLDRNRRR